MSCESQEPNQDGGALPSAEAQEGEAEDRKEAEEKVEKKGFFDLAHEAGFPLPVTRDFRDFMLSYGSFAGFRSEVTRRLAALPGVLGLSPDLPRSWCFQLCLRWPEMRNSGPANSDSDFDHLEAVVEEWWWSTYGEERWAMWSRLRLPDGVRRTQALHLGSRAAPGSS